MSSTLFDEHDVVLLDLDGTVYRGGVLVPGSSEAIGNAHGQGVAVRYVTNNASKHAEAVAAHLTSLGLSADAGEVSTSAQAGAAVLAEKLPPGAKVLVVGSAALASEVDHVGLVPVRLHEEEPHAVVQGHSPDTTWAHLAEACLAIRAGAVWVACNGDVTLPTERGELPGNGAMVAALRAATGQDPVVAGKPQRPLLERTIESAGGARPLMVGDRLDTDIAGAVNLGLPSLMVLTGVNTAADLLAAPPELRPTHVGADMRVLHRPAVESLIGEQPGWKVRIDETTLHLSTADETAPASYSPLPTLCACWWAVGSGPVRVSAEDAFAASALERLGLL